MTFSTDSNFFFLDQYWCLIGHLSYLTITRIEVCYLVHNLTQFMQHSKEDHWHEVLCVDIINFIQAKISFFIVIATYILMHIVTQIWHLFAYTSLNYWLFYNVGFVLRSLGRQRSNTLPLVLLPRLNITTWLPHAVNLLNSNLSLSL